MSMDIVRNIAKFLSSNFFFHLAGFTTGFEFKKK